MKVNEPAGIGGMTRREFARAGAAVGLGALVPESASGWFGQAAGGRVRYAIVGVGSRSQMYQKAINATFAQYAELVACCDTNAGRLELARQAAVDAGRSAPALYAAADFDRMVKETKPAFVVVTTPCGTHHSYTCRAMELGVDVVSEKAMTVNAESCQRIVDTQRRTGRACRIMFNYRYSPPRTQVKDLLMSGAIGDVLSVDFHWMLNTSHGTDYFRRWHAYKKMLGRADGAQGDAPLRPGELVALCHTRSRSTPTGKREFYTPAMARRLGLSGPHERCRTCPEKKECGFELDLAANANLKRLYLDNEHHDGYFRDRCVFRPDIEIEDTMNVIVTYDTNATLCTR